VKVPNANRSPVATLSAWAVSLLALVAALAVAGPAHGQTSGGTSSPGGTTTTPAPAPTTPAPGAPTQVFPIPTAHTFGDGFGAGRGHQGADIFAPCGTMAIAVMNAKVVYSGFQGAAGNYVVIRNKQVKRDYVYMHLQARSPLVKGAKVVKGQFVGAVGDTGRATGCHLHFEIWKGKWYRGGFALDPMPSLQAWDAYS
jgi:murein DD-endopeptidase MepM/ murein hydrolase activator NlpD